ncbi:MAG: hypothetical protein AAGH68_04750, partial [Pseudomonadota bacterium]
GIVDASAGYSTENTTGLWLKGDDAAGTQTLWVKVFDGAQWSDWEDFELVTTPNSPPTVTIADQFIFAGAEPINPSAIVDILDAEGDPIDRVELWDSDGIDNWLIHGEVVDASRGAWIDSIDAISLRADATPGSQVLWVRAYDGAFWSDWTSFDFETIDISV